MPIPDFQSVMLPLLTFLGDGKDHTNAEAIEHIAANFDLTDQDRKQLLPSGQARVLDNRIAWAKAHMRMAGLLESRARGVYRITERGKEVLSGKPSKINLSLLRSFPQYAEWRTKKKEIGPGPPQGTDETQTPEEVLETAYAGIRGSLSSELLRVLRDCSPSLLICRWSAPVLGRRALRIVNSGEDSLGRGLRSALRPGTAALREPSCAMRTDHD